MTLFMGLQKIMPTEIKTTVVPYPGYTVTFNNNDKSHQTITAQLEPTWKTIDYTDTNLDDFVAGAENVGVKLHLYINSAPGYSHGTLSWTPNTFVNGGMLTGPLTVNVTNATPIADVVIPTGYEDYYLYDSISKFYEDTNYDNYKTKSNISGNVIVFDIVNYLTSKTSIYFGTMFYDCYSLTSLDLSNLNTSKVTNMENMFYGCSSLTSLDLSNFDTSNVSTMGTMFYGCSSLTSLNISNFNTSNVTSTYCMFYNCSSLTSLDLSNWNTSNVTVMGNMFYNCSSLTSLDLSNFDTSKVTNMYGMFNSCSSLTSLDLSNFDTSKVTDMSNMFSVSNLRYLIIGSNTFKFQLKASQSLPSSCKILVPQALISTYQSATNWSTHASKFDAIENYTITRSNGQVTVTPK